MAVRKFATLSILFLIAFSVMWMGASISPSAKELVSVMDTPARHEVLSEEVNIIENAGFETGSFSPWINQGNTTYNEIQSSTVYSGQYALYMDSHTSSHPYEPVYQEIDTTITLAEAHLFSAAVYPTLVGNTAGQAGVDRFSISIRNTTSNTSKSVGYLWSGYTYPGGDLDVNVTNVLYLLFDLVPNQWNLIERNLLSDYAAFYGSPADASELVVARIAVLSHISNGDPGDFWVDDIKISTPEEEPTTSTEPTTTSPVQQWLSGWQYRKSHTINGATGAGTNYQVRITVHRETGTDSGEDVHIEGKCRPDFGDIRFTDDDGSTLLDYWLESYDSNNATFWVEVKDNLDTNQTIYIYYGHDTASSISDGGATFPLFDDFNRPDSDIVGGGWFDDCGDGNNSIENSLLKTVQEENQYCHIEKAAPSISNFVIHGKLKQHANAPASWKMAVGAYWGSGKWLKIGWRSDDHFEAHLYSDDLEDHGALSYANLDDTWCYYKIEATSSAIGFHFSLDGTNWVLVHSASRLSGVTGAPTLIIVGKGYENPNDIYPNLDWDNNYATAGPQYTNYADDIFVRKFVEEEPVQGSWSAEETPTTPLGWGGIDSWMTLIIIGGEAMAVVILVIAILKRKSGTGGSSQAPYRWGAQSRSA